MHIVRHTHSPHTHSRTQETQLTAYKAWSNSSRPTLLRLQVTLMTSTQLYLPVRQYVSSFCRS